MSSVVISGNTSGAITLSAPDVSGTNTATLPAATGTVMVSGNMPAFSAYAGSSQSIANATFTKVQINTEEFDTANAFDSTTNYRFTPLVAGYYQVNGTVTMGSNPLSFQISIYKNGSSFKKGLLTNTSASLQQTNVSALVYLNGSTDYIELYVFQGSGVSVSTVTSSDLTYFQAAMVRAS